MITTRVETSAIYKCSLERAFKCPMLCDITKVHTGYFLSPRVTHCTNDETWGKVGGSRRTFFAATAFSKEGGTALDTVLDRIENKYWKIEVSDLKFPTMGIKKFQGEWYTTANDNGTITVRYVYTLFTESTLLYPFHWFVTKVLWRIYMNHVLENVRKMAEGNEPFVQD